MMSRCFLNNKKIEFFRKINMVGMIGWAFVGFLAGIFINFLIFLFEQKNQDFFFYILSRGEAGNLWDLEFWRLTIILTLIFGLKGAGSKTKEERIQISEQNLSLFERIFAWVSCIIFTPIIAGPIMYYIWRNKYPKKAREANDISMVVFLIELMIILTVIFTKK